MTPEQIHNADAEKLKAMLSDAAAPETDAEWIQRIRHEYPYFSLPELLELRRQLNVGGAGGQQAVADAALGIADPMALERIAEPDGTRFDDFYPPQESGAVSTTSQAIDKFLETYGNSDPAETETLEKLIFNPVADYSQQLAAAERSSLPDQTPTGNSQDDRINRFILSVKGESTHNPQAVELPAPAPEPAPEATATKAPKPQNSVTSTPADNSLLSESLAKIYIKTHRYERAYEILSRLSLAFPEKNAYFADQLRFLRKLMVVEKCRIKRQAAETKSE